MINEFVRQKKIIILLGSGGVGKTTTSIALAIRAAMQGRRVGLLSIDPAKRLAAALGIELGNEMRQIKFPEGMQPSGFVKAAMLDQKTVFDGMVRRHAPSDSSAQKILDHPIYQAASTNLSGPLEYMALAKLRELANSPEFDLIVLDTPPDTHALDFLKKPNVLAGFFENKVMTWMLKPFSFANRFGLGKVMNFGEKMMGGIAKVAGVSALRSFADFLVLTQEVIEGFNDAGEDIVKLLRSQHTGFVLVTVPTPAAYRSAIYLQDLLVDMEYNCEAVIFNRCLQNPFAKSDSIEGDDKLSSIYKERILGEKDIVDRLAVGLAEGRGVTPTIIPVTEFPEDLHSAEALIAFSQTF